jgi:hypothetical protein
MPAHLPAALAEITAPSFVEDLASLSLDELRARRERSQAVENSLSYVRRLIHGRLDIVRGELERRRSGAERSELDAIIARLPELLADGSRSDALPRPPQDMEPGADADALVAELEVRVPASVIGSLPDLDDDRLAEVAETLTAHEREISVGRNDLHGVIDRLHAEIITRYQAGSASVDSLLG